MSTTTNVRVIDCYLPYQWPSQVDVYPYVSAGWREYYGTPGAYPHGRGMAPFLPPPAYEPPGGPWLEEATSSGVPPGSSPEVVLERSAAGGVEKTVLAFAHADRLAILPNAGLTHELARAVNDWTYDAWLQGRQDRLAALIVTPTQLPNEAAAEIRRSASKKGMAGVLIAGNGLSKPFGHPVYEPIFRAAADTGLPIVLRTGSDSPPNTFTQPTAGGLPSTYGEWYALRSQSTTAHLVSLMAQGMLEKFPGLKLVIAGAGIAWLTPWLWRFDADHSAYAAIETPWFRRRPRQILNDQVRVTAYSARGLPRGEKLERMLAIGADLGIENVICSASGYPSWDAEDPVEVAGWFPERWRQKMLSDNVREVFRW